MSYTRVTIKACVSDTAARNTFVFEEDPSCFYLLSGVKEAFGFSTVAALAILLSAKRTSVMHLLLD